MEPQFLPIWEEEGDFKFRAKSVHFEVNRWPKKEKNQDHVKKGSLIWSDAS